MSLIWIIIIGAIAGFIARLLSPAPNNPRGFFGTAALGVVGGVVATIIGRTLNLYHGSQTAGLIGGVIGSILVLVVWRAIQGRDAPGAM
jgi:uncharacterized membrane protein YeaQ/YmgE (transglycosylase-associated protein family)